MIVCEIVQLCNAALRGGVKVSTGALQPDKRAEERGFYKKRKLKIKR